jgi:hypothetical protein
MPGWYIRNPVIDSSQEDFFSEAQESPLRLSEKLHAYTSFVLVYSFVLTMTISIVNLII